MHRSIGVVVAAVAALAIGLSFEGCVAAPAGDARVERGRYLVHHVCLCLFCHSDVDWKSPGFPVVAGREGCGGVFADESVPFASLPAANLTPDETGIGSWSDAELDRAIRRGIGRDGRTLFPVMPSRSFSAMTDDDVAAVIAYLRTLPRIRNAVAKRSLPAAVEAMLRPVPERRPPEHRGEYLATIADCGSCHTPLTPRMQPNGAMAFGGGFVCKGPWGRAAAPNITSDPSGIAHYDEALFLKMMRAGNVGGRELNAIMPWSCYRGMTDDDLKAIFGHLRSLPKVQHRVDNVEEPTLCPKCGAKHGLGARNVR